MDVVLLEGERLAGDDKEEEEYDGEEGSLTKCGWDIVRNCAVEPVSA